MPHATRRVFGHLIFHPRIGASWLVFAVCAWLTAIVAMTTNVRPLPIVQRPVATATPQTTTQTTTPAPHSSRGRRHKTKTATAAPVHGAARPAIVPLPEWHERTGTEIAEISLAYGYAGWALYWGIPACLWLLGRTFGYVIRNWNFFSGPLAGVIAFLVGFWPALIVSVLFAVGGMLYSVFGGGILHFSRFWWQLCHPPEPEAKPAPAEAPPPAAPAVQLLHAAQDVLQSRPKPLAERLRELKSLLDQGLITPSEYESRKAAVLDEIAKTPNPPEPPPPPPPPEPPVSPA